MAILSIAKDLADLKERLNNITVAFDKSGKPVTTGDLEVGNAMAAFMRNTINPTLMCTAEYNPCLVHAGPFANIAVGQSSIIADRVGLKLFDYHVTESGFAADIGFEKFWNVKCRYSGLKPHVSVLTTTVRALKMHGGGPKVVAGKPLPEEYTKENVGLVEKGCANMVHMINVIRKSGINPVVCINRFYTDTNAEVAAVKKAAEAAGARCAESQHWLKGGEGALELADAVIDACNEKIRTGLAAGVGVEAAHRLVLAVPPDPFAVFVALVRSHVDNGLDRTAAAHGLKQVNRAHDVGGVSLGRDIIRIPNQWLGRHMDDCFRSDFFDSPGQACGISHIRDA